MVFTIQMKLCFGLLWLIFVVQAKIAIVSLAAGSKYIETVSIGFENKRNYAELHGYDFVLELRHLDKSRPIPWSKIKIIERLLTDYDWVCWMDADAIVMNTAIRLEEIIDPNYHVMICQDLAINAVNSGVLLVRNCPASYEFLKRIYNYTQFINHPWWEQQGIITDIKSHSTGVKVLPQRTMNAFHHSLCGQNCKYERGDFIMQFPGMKDLNKMKHAMLDQNKYVLHETPLSVIVGPHDYVTQSKGTVLIREKGLITQNELGDLANMLGFKSGVEVGTQSGGFTESLLKRWIQCTCFHVVDIWDHLPYYMDPANVAQAEHHKRYERTLNVLKPWRDRNIVKVHRKLSKEACKEITPVDFVYLDASKDYMSVTEDLYNYWPLVRRGGIMAGHDFIDCNPEGCLQPSNKWQVQSDGTYRYDNKAVKSAVLDFFNGKNITIHVTQESHPYKSWYVFKQ